jgi:hypothetical protein
LVTAGEVEGLNRVPFPSELVTVTVCTFDKPAFHRPKI